MCVYAPSVRLESAWNVTDRQRSSRISPGMSNRYKKTETVCSGFSAYTSPKRSAKTKEHETIFKSVDYVLFSLTLRYNGEFTGTINCLWIGNRLCLLLNQKLRIAERQAKRGFKLFIYKYQALPSHCSCFFWSRKFALRITICCVCKSCKPLYSGLKKGNKITIDKQENNKQGWFSPCRK